ncbi:hypothetical protein IRJ41_002685 [Triplophysa rosa]|uniref:Paraneoplastic antigen Ma-like C-terminal domain-containing protein n=1 Tax=Triplophysa rosa TaxID=992332 RepID=A0A9W8CAL4_TRIRA|nr:hypothetical protein IRJ41_002685 [Triplophysa rosa]
MGDELQELRELMLQLRAENEKLRQEWATVDQVEIEAGPSYTSATSANVPSSATVGDSTTERFVFVPRDRKCPKFNGRTGIGINEWVEEAQACMRVRHLSVADCAFFLFDHLEGEAREEIRYRSAGERENPEKIISGLRELYGCSRSYIALQQVFFSRRQHEGETLLEFSLALMGLLEKVKQCSPSKLLNADRILRDQFVECVYESSLRRELKQFIRHYPLSTLLEGTLSGARGRSHSVPLVQGLQYGVKGGVHRPEGEASSHSELSELREMFKTQQKQLDQLTQSIARLCDSGPRTSQMRGGPIICRRCHKPGYVARECDDVRVAFRQGDVSEHEWAASSG